MPESRQRKQHKIEKRSAAAASAIHPPWVQNTLSPAGTPSSKLVYRLHTKKPFKPETKIPNG